MSPRPARTSREEIVAAALSLLDTEGAEAFSMRRLAAGMGVDPKTLYYHLPDKAALFDAVVDHVWTSLPMDDPEPGAPWRDTIAGLGVALRQVLLSRPALVPLVATRPAVTPHMLQVVDRTLGALATGGLPGDEAMRVIDCVVGFVVGKVQGELRQPVGGVGVTHEQAFAGLSPQTHPHLVAALQAGYDWSPEMEFMRGLRAMLDGWSVPSLGASTTTA